MLQKDKATKIKSQKPSFNTLLFLLSLQSLLCNDFSSTPIKLLTVCSSLSDHDFIIAPVKDTFESYCLP